MTEFSGNIYGITGWAAQFLLAAAGIAAVLNAVFAYRPRWRVPIKGWHRREPPRWWLTLVCCNRDNKVIQDRRVMLKGSGLSIEAPLYVAIRRSALVFVLFIVFIEVVGLWVSRPLPYLWQTTFIMALVGMGIMADRPCLEAFKRYRTDRIRKEIVLIISQLLYYSGSRLHLHGKLMRCMPYTRMIRGDMQLLLNEWYYDSDAALGRFKARLGTHEAYGFTETIRSLRQFESREVYEMLREVVTEYKANIELAKAGRKETTSYLLFVLAGIPILYTFQLFLYPWVQEAQKLFDALNP